MANKRICDSCGYEASGEDQECPECEGILMDTESMPAKKAKKKKAKK